HGAGNSAHHRHVSSPCVFRMGSGDRERGALYDNTTIRPEPAQMGTDRIARQGSSPVDSRSWHCFDAAALQGFAEGLLRRGGLTAEQARDTAQILVEADLMGHTTHGLQLLAAYLRDIEAGRMASAGEPEVVQDHPGAVTWDGHYLPGPWLVLKAM